MLDLVVDQETPIKGGYLELELIPRFQTSLILQAPFAR
jgi:hypothetical protein